LRALLFGIFLFAAPAAVAAQSNPPLPRIVE
jgi:hypothetical protein